MSATSLIFGFHAVSSRLRAAPDSVVEILLSAERRDRRAQDLLQAAAAAGVRVLLVDRARLNNLVGDRRHQGVVARVRPRVLALDLTDVLANLKEPPLFLVLDGIKDPHNLGACLRVADAMGVHAVIAPKDRAVGLTATVRKVACGAAETVPFLPVTNLARTLASLKERGVWTVGAAGDAQADLFHARLTGPLAWVLGAEGEGLRRLTREVCDELVRIPMFGSVESLNVSVAAGICLFETRRQRVHAAAAAPV
jgi:23S rRNA (guanosine2251-2'-O)-methyltransferase